MVIDVGKRLRLKFSGVILKKSTLEEDEEKKEGVKAPEKKEEKSVNKEEKIEHKEVEMGEG